MADIKFEIDNRASVLDELNDQIVDETMRVIVNELLDTMEGPTANAHCPVHKEPPHITISMSSAGELKINVTNCCEEFAQRKTAPLRRPVDHFQTAHFRPDLKLTLNVQGDPHLFVFDANKINTLVIGRGDPGSGEKPDIDVNGFGEEASGVSRRHASILWVEGALHIVDNNSSNGTYVDERRIEADKPYILHDGDNVRLGELVLHVRLTASNSAESR